MEERLRMREIEARLELVERQEKREEEREARQVCPRKGGTRKEARRREGNARAEKGGRSNGITHANFWFSNGPTFSTTSKGVTATETIFAPSINTKN